MNIFILSVLLFADIFLSILIFRNWTSASLWITGMFYISSIAYWLYFDYFMRDITVTTVLLIQSSIMFTIIGEYIGLKGRCVIGKTKKINTDKFDIIDSKPYLVKARFIYIVSIFILGIGIYRYLNMYRYTKELGNTNFFSTVYYIRGLFAAGDYSVSTLIMILTAIAEGFAYVFLFYFFYNLLVLKKREPKLLLPIIAYFIMLISTTGRTAYMKFLIIMIGVIYVFLNHSDISYKKMNKKMFKYVLHAMVMLASIFFMFGALVRKSNRTFLKYFADYFATGTFGLDEYIRNPWEANDIIGQYTLSNFYYFFNKFGANYKIPAHHLDFFYWANGKSNIYTALALPLQDYGVFGLLLSRFMIAFIYSQLWIYLKREYNRNKILIPTIIFGYFLYTFFSYPIADRAIEFLQVLSFPIFIFSLIFCDALYRRSVKRGV